MEGGEGEEEAITRKTPRVIDERHLTFNQPALRLHVVCVAWARQTTYCPWRVERGKEKL